ncbi:MAG: hypothetical protein JWL90_1474 [Chthoniobacteraceae bacterium]|nr:hypothetical protein [Chthoniobacteraceae bacterium]MDB6173612.1 hypothetical protein [Chthoniobacteraceae bacterium]
MTERSIAEEHLRVIRSLMERSTIYRAISAPTAAVGGVISIVAAIALIAVDNAGGMTVERFLFTWLSVLLVTLLANFYFLWRAAVSRKEIFVSPGMRMAIRAVLPPFLCGAAITLYNHRSPTNLPEAWILFYGLGLLAMSHFAPRSIAWLGWSFVIAGIGLWFLPWKTPAFFSPFSRPVTYSCLEMAFTFGLFHLIYALYTIPRESKDSSEDSGLHV